MEKRNVVLIALAVLVLVVFLSIRGQNANVPETPAIAATAPVDIAGIVLDSSDGRIKTALKIERKDHDRSALTAALALDESAQQIRRVEASGFADHNMDTAIALDGQKKDLASALNRWNDEYHKVSK
jgi:hypothetical protein